jgi:GSCFA family
VENGANRSSVDPNWMWDVGAPLGQGKNLLDLVRDGKAHATPSKPAMRRAGPEALLDGFLPPSPLIDPETRVLAMGSCFAALFVQWLAENGFNRHLDPGDDSSLLRNPLDSPVAVAQQFRWAFGELDSERVVWYSEDKRRFEATEAQRGDLQEALQQANVLILTLGLAECWFDLSTDEVIWRVPPVDYEGAGFAPRVTGVAESVQALETIDRLRRAHMPKARIIYTVSPVRFHLTLRPMAALVANAASKAIVRASIDEFMRRHADEFGDVYFYFPSYEIVREYLVDPFSDNRHVHRHHSRLVIDLFARHYTSLPIPERQASDGVAGELETTIERLEEENELLQETCDQRLAVIEELSTACAERLALIERLDAELARLKVESSSSAGGF